jgi:hypothetical protein
LLRWILLKVFSSINGMIQRHVCCLRCDTSIPHNGGVRILINFIHVRFHFL